MSCVSLAPEPLQVFLGAYDLQYTVLVLAHIEKSTVFKVLGKCVFKVVARNQSVVKSVISTTYSIIRTYCSAKRALVRYLRQSVREAKNTLIRVIKVGYSFYTLI